MAQRSRPSGPAGGSSPSVGRAIALHSALRRPDPERPTALCVWVPFGSGCRAMGSIPTLGALGLWLVVGGPLNAPCADPYRVAGSPGGGV